MKGKVFTMKVQDWDSLIYHIEVAAADAPRQLISVRGLNLTFL
jgi:hypothetical protein